MLQYTKRCVTISRSSYVWNVWKSQKQQSHPLDTLRVSKPIRSMVKKTTHRRLWERHLRSLAARTERSHCKISRTWQLAACEISRNVTTCIGISYPSSLEEVEQSSPLTVLVLFVFIFFVHLFTQKLGKPWKAAKLLRLRPSKCCQELGKFMDETLSLARKRGRQETPSISQTKAWRKQCQKHASFPVSQLWVNSTLTRLPSWRLTHWHLIWKQT